MIEVVYTMSKEYDWRTGRNCVFKIYYHLVFVTKYRRAVFTPIMLDRIKDLFEETCIQMEAELLEFIGEAHHVHLMISCPPKLAVAILVGKLKGKSSYFLRKEFWPKIKQKLWGKHLWSPSYCVVTCGGAPLSIVKQYIEQQNRPPDNRAIATSIRESKIKAG
jgi:putative transposase